MRKRKQIGCPFCGSENSDVMRLGSTPFWIPYCRDCGCVLREKVGKENAIKLWNTRTLDLRLRAAVKEIQMKMTGNKDYNAGMVASLLIIDEHIEELNDE